MAFHNRSTFNQRDKLDNIIMNIELKKEINKIQKLQRVP